MRIKSLYFKCICEYLHSNIHAQEVILRPPKQLLTTRTAYKMSPSMKATPSLQCSTRWLMHLELWSHLRLVRNSYHNIRVITHLIFFKFWQTWNWINLNILYKLKKEVSCNMFLKRISKMIVFIFELQILKGVVE